MSTSSPSAVGRMPDNYFIKLPRIPSAYTGFVNRVSDRFWERRFNISTIGRRAPTHPDANRYESLPYYAMFRILDHLDLRPDDVVVDLGSGMGRAVFVAASYPIRQSVGVEIEPELHEAALANARRARGLRVPTEFHCQSALDYDYREMTVLLLFNPFGPDTTRTMLQRLHESLGANPRTVRIAYVNATCAHVIAEHPWIRVVDWWEMSNWSRIKTPVHFYEARLGEGEVSARPSRERAHTT